MASSEKDRKFRFLKDQPLQSAEDFKRIKFGHREIGITLADIVQECETPFTIGLFGKWGSGKSSIAHFTREELGKRNIATVLFDVWKHEGDSLRRSFLKEFVDQLKAEKGACLDPNFALKDTLESSVTRIQKGKFRINRPKVKQMLKGAGLFALALGTVGFFAATLGFFREYWSGVTALIAFVTGGSLVVWLLKNATQFLTTETTTFTTERLQDPHEFEKEFGRILCATKREKILIIFDNLDRASHEKAVETLSTIKTFLEPKDVEIKKRQVVFLIPCDDEAIRSHLERLYNKEPGSASDADEFLKKFFNTVLWIPEFIPGELERFALDCLGQTSLAALSDDSLAWLIAKAYRENPRQIIQFVNILLANFLLIVSREGEGKDFEKDFAIKNNKEICFYLLLATKYPEVMSRLRAEKVNSLDEIPENMKEVKDIEQFRLLVGEVSPQFTIRNLKPYYTLRRSDQEKRFTRIEDLFTFLKDNQIDEAKQLAPKIPNIGDQAQEFSLAVSTELRRIRNPTSATYFINSLFHVLDYLGVHLTRQGCAEVLSVIRKPAVAGMIDIISPKHLYSSMLVPYPESVGDIAELWMTRLEEISKDADSIRRYRKYVIELMNVFAGKPDVAKPIKDKLKSVLASSYVSDLEVVQIFTESEDRQKQFLIGRFVKAYVDSLTENDLALYFKDPSDGAEKPGKLSVLNKFSREVFDTALLKALVSKLTKLIQAKTGVPWSPALAGDWRAFFRLVHDLLKKHDLKVITDSPEFSKFVDAVVAASDSIPEPAKRIVIMPLCILLESLPSCPRQSDLRAKMKEVYQKGPVDDLEYCLGFVDNLKEYVEKPPFTGVFNQRSMAEQPIFEFFYPKLPKQRRGTWLVDLLGHDLARGLQKIKQLNYRIPSKDDILRKILELAKGATVQQKRLCFEACNAMKCNGNAELMSDYVSQLKGVLCSTNASEQQVGHEAARDAVYLGEAHERDIVKSVFDWLQRLKEDEKYQPHSLEAIYMHVHHFNQQERDDLTQFCFDDLIRKSPNTKAINEGFKILQKLEPDFQAWRKNFIDVQSRFKQETNEATKSALLIGLKSLRPEETNKDNEAFWTWVDSERKE